MQSGSVDAYTVDGKTALKASSSDPSSEATIEELRTMDMTTVGDDDEKTIEMRVPETIKRVTRRRRLNEDPPT